MDVLRDFAYAKVVSAIAAGSPNDVIGITVDSYARLPSNPELAAGEFWMTIESDLPTGAFEIVRVLNTYTVASGGIGVPARNNVTVMRGQDGTAASAHPAGVYMKASITAAMWGRLFAYRRYVDLGNLALVGASSGSAVVTRQRSLIAQGAGVAQMFTNPTVFRGVAAGHASGATVVAGAMIFRGQAGAAHGAATTQGRLAYIDKLAATPAGHGGVTGAATVASSGTNYAVSNASASYSDNFNRADNIAPGTLSSGNATWTEDTNTDWQITSNALTSFDSGTGYCRITTGFGNFTMAATATLGRFTGIGIKGGMSGGSFSGTGYALVLNNTGQYGCWKNGSFVTPTTGAQVGSLSAGSHTFAITFQDGLVTYKIDGTTVCTFLDVAPLTGTNAGFIASSLGIGTFDDMTITASAPSTTAGKATVTASFTNLGQLISSGSVFSDNFNRADGALAAPYYLNPGTIGIPIISNQMVASSATSSSNVAVEALDTLAGDGTYQFDVVYPASNGTVCDVQVQLRRNLSTNNYLLFATNPDTGGSTGYTIYKSVGGALTSLVNVNGLFAMGNTYTIKFILAGTSLQVFINGVLKSTSTVPATVDGTSLVFVVDRAGAGFDNLSVISAPIGKATVTGSLSKLQLLSNATPSYADNFNRTDNATPGTLSSGNATWTEDNNTGWAISSNTLTSTTTSTGWCRITTGLTNFAMQATCLANVFNGIGIKGTMTSNDLGASGYALVRNSPSSQYVCWKNGNNVTPTTGAATGTLSAGSHVFAVSFQNGLVTYKVDGVTVCTYQDPSPLTGTNAGFITTSLGAGTFDDMTITPLDAGTVGVSTVAADLSRFADDFNRADSATTPGGKWTVAYGVGGIVSNQMYAVSGATSPQDTARTMVALAQTTLSDIDITWQWVMPASGGAQADFFISSSSDGTDAVDCLITTVSGANTAYIWERDSGVGFGANHSQAAIGALTGTVTLRAVRSGSTVQFYVNGTLTVTRTLTNAHAGKYFGPRLNLDGGGSSPSLRLDNVKVTT